MFFINSITKFHLLFWLYLLLIDEKTISRKFQDLNNFTKALTL